MQKNVAGEAFGRRGKERWFIGEVKAVLCLVLLVAAAAMDIRSARISNRLILAGLAAGLAVQAAEFGLLGVGVFIRNASIPVILYF